MKRNGGTINMSEDWGLLRFSVDLKRCFFQLTSGLSLMKNTFFNARINNFLSSLRSSRYVFLLPKNVSKYICWLIRVPVGKYSWYIVLCRRLCLLNSYQTLIKNEAYQKYILYSLHLRNIMALFEEARVVLEIQVHVYCFVITLHHTEATGKTRFTKCIVV